MENYFTLRFSHFSQLHRPQNNSLWRVEIVVFFFFFWCKSGGHGEEENVLFASECGQLVTNSLTNVTKI